MAKKEQEEETVLEFKFSPHIAVKEGFRDWDDGKRKIDIPLVDPKEQKQLEKRYKKFIKKNQ